MTQPSIHRNDAEWPEALERVYQRAKRKAYLGYILKAAVVVVILAELLWLSGVVVSDSSFWLWCVLGYGVVLGLFLIGDARFPMSRLRFAQHVERMAPDMEECVRLYFKPNAERTLLEHLAVKRVETALLQRERDGSIERLIPKMTAITRRFFIVGSSVCILLGGMSLFLNSQTPAPQSTASLSFTAPHGINRVTILISPPEYTGARDSVVTTLTFEALEGSHVAFTIEVNDDLESLYFLINATDTLFFSPDSSTRKQWRSATTVKENWIYTLAQQHRQEIRHSVSQWYHVRCIPDAPPEVRVLTPKDSRYDIDGHAYLHGEAVSAAIKAVITDDYAISSADLVITVAKGKGESVKFKESRIALPKYSASEYGTAMSFSSLGMGIGDEAYLYLEARDNRQPIGQTRRSDMFYFQIQDTTLESDIGALALGMKVKPEYFRSQRQIIIDTETLLRDKARLSAKDFGERAEEIGVEQKLLRLRYGKFLGEEFESSIGPSAKEIESLLASRDKGSAPDSLKTHPLMKFIKHVHDEHCSHENPTPDGSAPSAPENLMLAFAHIHDTEEGATFYAEEIKRDLKAALAEMWNAELHLRMHDPKAALPYEYKALKIIKALQQKSRLYVQRVGFDAPPLKPDEKRLTGELGKIQSPSRRSKWRGNDTTAMLQAARKSYELLHRGKPLSAQDIKAIEDLFDLISHKAKDNPLPYLDALRSLRLTCDLIAAQSVPDDAVLMAGERALLELLPAESLPLIGYEGRSTDLGQRYHDEIRKREIRLNP